ncbi:MAG TPA: TonB-dependent receptor [Burkholderiales bacterium]|nr:TonB-dependent receptor [Burkholderiales bacterium]
MKKTKVALAFFSAFFAQHSPAQESETTPQVRIIGHYENAVGTSDAASQGTITPQLIEARPMLRPGEVLEYVPGVIITQHSGDGKANQYFLRGFNLDHGTDFLTTIDHMPVNMPTHAHGQGYSDINFLLPELVSRIAYKKGPYFAEEGDFSSAGAADIDYYTKMPKGIASLGLGSNGYRRAMAADSFDADPGHLLYGFELFHNDGPWINPEDYRKLNGVLRFSEGTNADGYTLSLMGYTGKWNATDQIPQRVVDDQTISRFGAIDPTNGGKTSRYSVSLDRHKTLDNGAVFHMDVYAVKYRLNLFSNFTYFLNDPTNGDQFEQADDRTVVGLTPRWVFNGKWDERQITHKLGLDARRDDINVALYDTTARDRRSPVRSDRVLQTGVGLYYENAIQWTDTFRSIAGVREDFYGARVDNDLGGNSGTTNAHITSPKLSFIFGPFDKTEYFLNYGQGFHSNDARGTTITTATKVPALVRTRGEEIGIRTEVISHLQSSLSLWRLALDSELVFKGDTGTTEASRPSLRRGIEWSNRYIPHDWLLVDLDLSASRAQFTDNDPKGSYIPGAIDRVASLGVTVKDLGPWSGTVHARYVGPRPLIEDNSQRSQSSVIFSARASYKVDPKTSVNFDVFNLFNRKSNDIEYYYASRLNNPIQPEPPSGVKDIHFHPAEPRTARLALVMHY